MWKHILPIAAAAGFTWYSPSFLPLGLESLDTQVVALAIALHILLLLAPPEPPAWHSRAFIYTMGLWGVHLFYSSYLAFYKQEIPDGWKPLFNTGMVHILVLVSALIDYTFTWRVLPAWLLLSLSLTHATCISAIMLFCCGAAHKSLLSFLSAACVPHLCITLLPPFIIRPAVSAAETARPTCKVLDESEDWHAPYSVSPGAEVQPGAGPSTSTPHPLPAEGPSEAEVQPDPLSQPLSAISTHATSRLPLNPTSLEPDSSRAEADAMQATTLLNAYRANTYKSCLGQKVKVSLKLRSGLDLSQVPAGIVPSLRNAVATTCPPLHVLSVGVRAGCILMNLDVVRPWDVGGAGASDQDSLPPQVAEQLTRKVLSLVEGLLSDGQGVVTDPATRTPGVYMRVQVGCELWNVEWCGASRTWLVVPVQASSMDTLPPPCHPSLGLVTFLGSQVFSYAGPGSQQGLRQLSAPQHPNSPTLVHELRLQAQLWGSCGGATGLAFVEEPMCVAGWVPPGPGDHTASWPWSQEQVSKLLHGECCSTSSITGSTTAGEGTVRLLARCAGGYLVTRVEGSAGPPPGHVPGMALYQVVVEVPDEVLVRHHEGGAPSALLPLHLELWQDEMLLATTTLLHLPTSGAQPWWWGAPPALVAHALQELDALDWTTHELSHDQQQLGSYLEFSRDLTIWLEEVRATAIQSGVCVAARRTAQAPTSMALRFAELSTPLLSDAERLALRDLLVAHTRALGFTSLPAVINHQYRTVMQPLAGQHTSVWRKAARGARTLVAGYSCSMCEQRYKVSLSSSMLVSPILSSTCILVIAALLMVTSLAYEHAKVYIAFNIPWVALHLTGLVHHMRGRASGKPTLCSVCLVYSWCWRVLVQAAYAVQLLPVPHYVSHQFTNFTWLFNCAMLGLCEQMQASVLLHPRITLLLGLLVEVSSVVMLALVNNKDQDTLFILMITPVIVVGSRLMLDVHMRHQLNKAHSAKQGVGRLGVTRRVKQD